MENIELIIDTGKRNYLLGEPVTLLLQIVNKQPESIQLKNAFDLDSQFVSVYIESLDSQNEKRFTPVLCSIHVQATKILNSNGTLRSSGKIFYGTRGWTFHSPGRYKIRVRYNAIIDMTKSYIVSNTIELKIRAPANEEEKDQVNSIMGDEQAIFLLFDGDIFLNEGINKLKNITEKYPESSIAGYAHFALGARFMKSTTDPYSNAIINADFYKALENLQRTIDILLKQKELDIYYLTLGYMLFFISINKIINETPIMASSQKQHFNQIRNVKIDEFITAFKNDPRSDFIVPSINTAAVIRDGESNWHKCNKCQALFYSGLNGGGCAAGGKHDHGGEEYVMLKHDTLLKGSHQGNWRRCSKCQVLFYPSSNGGICYKGEEHEHDAPNKERHALVTDDSVPLLGQSNWRKCSKCQVLFYSGLNRGICYKGEEHEPDEGLNYTLIYFP